MSEGERKMATYRYTICAYYPDLYRPDLFFPFAVLVAKDNEVMVVGTNLDAYQMRSQNVLEKVILHNSIESLERMLDNVIESSECETGFDVLDRIVSSNQSSIQFWPFKDEEGSTLHEAAYQVFSREILPRITPQRVGRKWRATPRIDTRELVLT